MDRKDVKYVPHRGQVCCYNCGGFYQVTPCSISLAQVVLKQFDKEHKKCRPSDEGKALLDAVVAETKALPPERRNVFGKIGPSKPPKTLGEKVAHHLYMDEMAKRMPDGFSLEQAKDEEITDAQG